MLAKKNLVVALMGLGLVAGCGSSQGFTATSPGASPRTCSGYSGFG